MTIQRSFFKLRKLRGESHTLSVKTVSVMIFVGIDFSSVRKNSSLFTDGKLIPAKYFNISRILRVAY